MVIKSVGVFSVGKIMAILQGAIGLIVGAIFALFSVLGGILGGAMGSAMGGSGAEGIAGILFGGAALIILPTMYALFGFIFGIVGALIYNLVAGIVGGIEVVLE